MNNVQFPLRIFLKFCKELANYRRIKFLRINFEASNWCGPSLRKKCPYSELFWSASSRIWTEYGDIRSIAKIRTRITPNTDIFYVVHFMHQNVVGDFEY